MIDDINIAKYVDDNILFLSGDTPLRVIAALENAAEKPFVWFTNNQMKANHDKYLLLKARDFVIKNSDNRELVTSDVNLNFKCHFENVLKKASKKVQVLAGIATYMSTPKRKLLIHSFFTSQFNYYRLLGSVIAVEMSNNNIQLRERCFRIDYSDKTSSFEKLLEKDGTVTILTRNLQTLASDMFKVYKTLPPAVKAILFPCSTK